MATIFPVRLSIASVFLTFFVDNLCWAMVFPIFAPYFVDPNNLLFSPSVLPSTRIVILGFFLMAFPLGQFLGAPILGEYADRHGRKKALGLSVFCTMMGVLLTAWSVKHHQLPWLFIGRLMTGVFASSGSICLACVTDLSESDKEKVKNFGHLSLMAGFSFIVGAFVGGRLSDPTNSSSFSPSLPLWIASGLTGLNFLFVLFGFKETSQPDATAGFHFFQSLHNIRKALQTKSIKRVYTVYFLFLFSWTLIFQFAPVIAVQKYSFTSSNIGDMALFMGICWAIGSGYLNKLLARFFSPADVLKACLLAFMVCAALIVFLTGLADLILLIGLCAVIGGLGWPLCNGMISNLATRDIQGKIMGMSQ